MKKITTLKKNTLFFLLTPHPKSACSFRIHQKFRGIYHGHIIQKHISVGTKVDRRRSYGGLWQPLKTSKKRKKALVLYCWRCWCFTTYAWASWKAFAKKNSKIKQYSSGVWRNENELAYAAELASSRKICQFIFVPFLFNQERLLECRKRKTISKRLKFPVRLSEFCLCGSQKVYA